MTEKEKQQWLDAPVEWDDYSGNPTLEEAMAGKAKAADELIRMQDEKKRRCRDVDAITNILNVQRANQSRCC